MPRDEQYLVFDYRGTLSWQAARIPIGQTLGKLEVRKGGVNQSRVLCGERGEQITASFILSRQNLSWDSRSACKDLFVAWLHDVITCVGPFFGSSFTYTTHWIGPAEQVEEKKKTKQLRIWMM